MKDVVKKHASKNAATEPTETLARARKFAKHVANILARTSLPEVGFVLTFVIGRYLKNADFSYPSELLLPLFAFLVLCTITYYLFYAILRRHLSAHLAALPLAYMLYSFQHLSSYGYTYVKLLLPGSWETPFGLSFSLVLLATIMCGLFGFGAAKLVTHVKALRDLQIPKVVMFVVLFLLATQFAKAALLWIKVAPQLAYKHDYKTYAQDKSKITSKPDIYYFVFDRYTNNAALKDIYNYDNSYFTDALARQGMTTHYDAYANYPFTMMSVSSTMAMEYHTGLDAKFGDASLHSAFPYRTMLNDPPVARLLKQNGYTYNQVSSWWDFTRIGIHADNNPTESFRLRVFNKSFYMSDLQRDLINTTILSPWFKKGISFGDWALIKYDRDTNPRQNFENQMTELKRQAKASKSTSPQFTFAHILTPHDPYIFMPDGSQPTYDGNRTDNGVDEKVKYINQLTYANKRITDLIQTIRKDNPDAVIIMQSDEGPYPKEFRGTLSPRYYYNPKNLALPQLKQKMGILASYYLPGVDEQTLRDNIHSSVDPFRLVLTHYLGYDMPPLPECHFAAGNKFNLYSYDDLTERLTGTLNESCQALQ